MSGNSEEKRFSIEQHFQDGLMLILVALCGWMAWSINDSSIRIATLTERVSALQVQVAEATSNRYTTFDASRDRSSIDDRLSEINARLRQLETGSKR